MWWAGELPEIAGETHSDFTPSAYNEARLEEAIAFCKTEKVRVQLCAIASSYFRAAHTIIEMNYYPTRFNKRLLFYDKPYSRTPHLDLPFASNDFDGVVFLDDIV